MTRIMSPTSGASPMLCRLLLKSFCRSSRCRFSSASLARFAAISACRLCIEDIMITSASSRGGKVNGRRGRAASLTSYGRLYRPLSLPGAPTRKRKRSLSSQPLSGSATPPPALSTTYHRRRRHSLPVHPSEALHYPVPHAPAAPSPRPTAPPATSRTMASTGVNVRPLPRSNCAQRMYKC